jgi:peroxiredoxin Q/BCP
MFQSGHPHIAGPVGKIVATDADALAVMRLRMFAETARAIAQAMTNVAFGRTPVRPLVLSAGDPAPEFALPASDGLTYRLSDFRGRTPVVIAWFPKAFTGGCTAECRSLSAYSAALARSRVRCLAASVDTVATNAEFAGALGLTFPILSDTSKDVARAYGVLGASGFASRWTFYIGADGRILAIDKDVRSASHGRDVAARLTELGIS